MLYHPRHPNPWPMLEWWRKAESDMGHAVRVIESRSSVHLMVEVTRDIRLVLEHQGHHKEAQWLKDFIYKVFPSYKKYSGKSRRERLTVDGKPLPSP
jgi:hypothetical protein